VISTYGSAEHAVGLGRHREEWGWWAASREAELLEALTFLVSFHNLFRILRSEISDSGGGFMVGYHDCSQIIFSIFWGQLGTMKVRERGRGKGTELWASHLHLPQRC